MLLRATICQLDSMTLHLFEVIADCSKIQQQSSPRISSEFGHVQFWVCINLSIVQAPLFGRHLFRFHLSSGDFKLPAMLRRKLGGQASR